MDASKLSSSHQLLHLLHVTLYSCHYIRIPHTNRYTEMHTVACACGRPTVERNCCARCIFFDAFLHPIHTRDKCSWNDLPKLYDSNSIGPFPKDFFTGKHISPFFFLQVKAFVFYRLFILFVHF